MTGATNKAASEAVSRLDKSKRKRIVELEGQLKALRAAAVKVLGACDQPLALEVALTELERVVRATPLT